MANTYTIADLQAMSNDDLNALAAELRGFSNHPLAFSLYDVDANGRSVEVCEKADWRPATDRNQSRELLRWAAARFGQDYAFLSDMVSFIEFQAVYDSGEIGEPVEIEPLFTIPGNTARAETEAFCAAMLATEGRLANGTH